MGFASCARARTDNLGKFCACENGQELEVVRAKTKVRKLCVLQMPRFEGCVCENCNIRKLCMRELTTLESFVRAKTGKV